jgi:hypothetical protein
MVADGFADTDGDTLADTSNCDQPCPANTYKKALVVDSVDDPGIPGDDRDFHWYRQDDNQMWSHKPGSTKATNLDASGNPILDPRTADRSSGNIDYADFCGCFCCGGAVNKQ